MPVEHSAGAVIFRKENDQTLFLLLHYPTRAKRRVRDEGKLQGRQTSSTNSKREHWDFSKGHIEKGEKDADTVKREVREETGLEDIKIISGFQERIKYYFTVAPRRTIFKTVVFYLAETKTKDVKISKEHIGFKWLSYEEASKQLTFEKPKNILKKANQFLGCG